MRLELEEYNFTVEYLKGTDNYVADALSRLTITDLKNIQTSNTILKVTTRNQSRQKFCAGKDQIELHKQSIEKASKPNVYEVINNDEVRIVVTLHVNNKMCLFKHGKKITAGYDVSDLYKLARPAPASRFCRVAGHIRWPTRAVRKLPNLHLGCHHPIV